MLHVMHGCELGNYTELIMNNIRAILCFVLLSFVSLHGYTVVLVHLGNVIPDHLFDAVKQIHLFNTDTSIVVIAEQDAINRIDSNVSYVIDYVTFIPCESLTSSDLHTKFKHDSPLDKTSWGGLWYKSTERFFYIEELMRQYNLSDVFHFENDIMLYVDLEELMPVFRKYTGIATVFDADQRCIPSFMYITHADAIEKLIRFMTEKASRGLFDMHIIALFKHEHSQEIIDHLPIIMPAYAHRYGLRNAVGHGTNTPERYWQHIDLFNSIFDAAAIGQYLGGTYHDKGTQVGFINETCLFNASQLAYVWKKDAQGRKVPYAVYDNVLYRINNLHIHSKDLKKFSSI